MFAGITGDFAPVHVNEEYMKRTRFEGRIAHGILILGLASIASSQSAARASIPGVSAGYDRGALSRTGPVRRHDSDRLHSSPKTPASAVTSKA
jgi:acyl dehydratase